MAHGFGKQVFPSGVIYEGHFKNSKRSGQGKYIYANGSFYEGEWKDNMSHGYGKRVYPSGKIYEGHYKNDKRSGQGKEIYPDGSVYEGQWVNGKVSHSSVAGGVDGGNLNAADNLSLNSSDLDVSLVTPDGVPRFVDEPVEIENTADV